MRNSRSRPLLALIALALLHLAFCLAPAQRGHLAHAQNPPKQEDWALQHQEITDHAEAELLVRHGSIDNLTCGWPRGFDPFSGAATPAHYFPWALRPQSARGTDRIMVPSSYRGRPPTGHIDGYTYRTRRPANNPQPIPITFTPPRFPIRSAILQVFVDDFQSPVWRSRFQATMNGKRVAAMEEILNALDQSGPIGKLVTLQLPKEIVETLNTGKLTIFVDDPTTGAGDGYAFDFFRLLINPRGPKYHGIVRGRVTSTRDGTPLVGAIVSAGGVVETRTDANGNYELRGVPAGHASIRTSADAYFKKIALVDLLAGQTVRLDVALKHLTLGPEIIDLSRLGELGTRKKYRPAALVEPLSGEPPIPSKMPGTDSPGEVIAPKKTESEGSPKEPSVAPKPAEPAQPTEASKTAPAGDEDDNFAWPVLGAVVAGLVVLVLLLVLINRRLGRLVVVKQRCSKCGKNVKVRGAAHGGRFHCPACGTAQSVA